MKRHCNEQKWGDGWSTHNRLREPQRPALPLFDRLNGGQTTTLPLMRESDGSSSHFRSLISLEDV